MAAFMEDSNDDEVATASERKEDTNDIIAVSEGVDHEPVEYPKQDSDTNSTNMLGPCQTRELSQNMEQRNNQHKTISWNDDTVTYIIRSDAYMYTYDIVSGKEVLSEVLRITWRLVAMSQPRETEH